MLSIDFGALITERRRLELLEQAGKLGPRQVKALANVRAAIARAEAEGVVYRPSHPDAMN